MLITNAGDLPDPSNWREFAYDLETCDPHLKTHGAGDVRGDGHVAGIAVKHVYGEPLYVPVGHETGPRVDRRPVQRWLTALFDRPQLRVFGANLNYDRGWTLNDLGVSWRDDTEYVDVQLLEPLIDEQAFSFDLDRLGAKYLGETKTDDALYAWLAEKFGGRATRRQQAGRIWKAPPEVVHDYACGDVDLPLRIADEQVREVERQNLWEVVRLEQRVAHVVFHMRQRGVRVDLKGAEQLRDKLRRQARAAQRRLGKDTSVWAGDDLARVFDAHGIAYPHTAVRTSEKTGKQTGGKPSFTQAWLERRAAAGCRVSADVLQVRKTDKAVSTFIEHYVLEKQVNGRVHANFNQLRTDEGGTVSGRFCVAGDTLIETGRGRVRIDQLEPTGRERVLSHTGRWNRVLRRIYKGVEPMIRVGFADGSSVKCTRNHRLLTATGWISAGNLSVNDRVIRHERFEARPEEPGALSAGGEAFPGGGQADDPADRRRDGGVRTHGAGHTEAGRGPGKAEGREEPAVLQEQDGFEEPHARAGRDAAPQPLGALARRGRVRDDPTSALVRGQRDAEPGEGAPGRHVSAAGDDALTGRPAGTPHRRGSDEQRPEQPGPGYREGARQAPREVTVTTIEPVGALPVWDLEVERDHSYAAAGVFHHNSSSDPNLQNIPARDPELGPLLRGLWLPEEGEDWEAQDYAQVEPRLTLHYAPGPEAERIREQYRRDPTIDCYLALLAEAPDDVTRKVIKTIWLGLLYGMGLAKLAGDLNVDEKTARHLIETFNRAAPYVKRLKRGVTNKAKRAGFVHTLSGRRARFEFWEPADWDTRKELQDAGLFKLTKDRQAVVELLRNHDYQPRVQRAWMHKVLNRLIQGGAADIMKRAMVAQWEDGIWDVLGCPLVTVHDENGWSVPRTAGGREAAAEAARVMATSTELRLPLHVDRERGPTWGQVEELTDAA